MALELKQSLKMSQQLVMTPQLQQAIKLLQLSRMELQTEILNALVENPVLEEEVSSDELRDAERAEALAAGHEPPPEEPGGEDAGAAAPAPGDGEAYREAGAPEAEHRLGEEEGPRPDLPDAPAEALAEVGSKEQPDDIDWEAYLNNFQLTGPTAPSNSGNVDFEDLPSHAARLSTRPTLVDHLLEQVGLDGGPVEMDPPERELAAEIVGNLDENGYFRVLTPLESPDPGYRPPLDPALDPDGALERWLQERIAKKLGQVMKKRWLTEPLRRLPGARLREELAQRFAALVDEEDRRLLADDVEGVLDDLVREQEDRRAAADEGSPRRKSRARAQDADRDPDGPWAHWQEDPVDPLIRLVASRWGQPRMSLAEEDALLDRRVGPPDREVLAAREREEEERRTERIRRIEERVEAWLRVERALRQDEPEYQALTELEKWHEHRNWDEHVTRWRNERELARKKAAELGLARRREAERRPGVETVSFTFAARVLAKCQRLEPAGVCARDLEECLLVQARARGHGDGLVPRIIRRYLKQLESKNLTAIAREEKVPVEEVVAAAEVISALESRPARGFAGDEAGYIIPDVFIEKVGDRYEVVMNDDGLSKLRIGRRYLEALRRGDADEYVKDKLNAARSLIKSIHQRQRTIHKVTESIIKFQQDFLDRGIAHLKPLILKDVAEDIEMHESTVSRVTSNKYVHTPQGIFELKYFFNSGISRTGGGDEVASEAVKNEIKNIVAGEDGKRPYSDQKIVEILRGRGIEIARRTVAKYREVLGILPSSKRRSFR